MDKFKVGEEVWYIRLDYMQIGRIVSIKKNTYRIAELDFLEGGIDEVDEKDIYPNRNECEKAVIKAKLISLEKEKEKLKLRLKELENLS